MQSIRFLHDLGSIQHFDNDFLRSKVVINPQWIVNVMSCVVSVHENAIKVRKSAVYKTNASNFEAIKGLHHEIIYNTASLSHSKKFCIEAINKCTFKYVNLYIISPLVISLYWP